MTCKMGRLSVIMMGVLTSGCSFLSTTSVMRADKKETSFQTVKNYTYFWGNHSSKAYSIQTDSLLYTISGRLSPLKALTWGPPFIPIIPGIAAFGSDVNTTDSNYFFVDIKTKAILPEVAIHLDSFHFYINGQLTQPNGIETYSAAYIGLPQKILEQSKIGLQKSNVSTYVIASKDSNQTFRFSFPISNKKVKQLDIRLSNGKMTTLQLKRHHKLYYTPYFLN